MSSLVGCILFMGAVTGEGNHQPRIISDDIPPFSYTYGPSFIMFTMAFCCDEIAAVLSVYLFIIRHKEQVRKKHAKLHACKSKADQIQNYFKRKGRNHSQGSNGDASRRSSYLPPSQETFTYGISRDLSQMALTAGTDSYNSMTGIDGNYKLSNSVLPSAGGRTDSPILLIPIAITPPPEFRTEPDDREMDHPTPIHTMRCKTTSV